MNGELRERDRKVWGIQVAVESNTTRLAGDPAATRCPWSAKPPMRAGVIERRSKNVAMSISVVVSTTAAAVSRPSRPGVVLGLQYRVQCLVPGTVPGPVPGTVPGAVPVTVPGEVSGSIFDEGGRGKAPVPIESVADH